MPRGVYPRKKKAGGVTPQRQKRSAGGIPKVLAQLRAEKTRAEDQVVALGTAIEALEVLES